MRNKYLHIGILKVQKPDFKKWKRPWETMSQFSYFINGQTMTWRGTMTSFMSERELERNNEGLN